MIFFYIGEILEQGVHESSVCDAGVYRFPNFHSFKQFPFQIPYNLDHFFNSQLHLTIPFCLFNIRHMLPISRNLYLFPISPKPCQLSPLSVRSFVFSDIFTSTFISNSADGLVYPSTLHVSGEVLCDTLRLV